jgi:DNA-binding IclR family transcriptional regulator
VSGRARRSPDEEARGGIQALDAALVVLRGLSAAPGPLSLSQIAREAGMSASKVHRYLASFARAGIVRQTQRLGLYDLGKAAVELGLSAMARFDVVERAAERLEELVEETGAAALLAVWGTHGPTVVRWERTASFVITSLGLGTTLPLLNSATGHVFLAFSPTRVVAERLRDERRRARALGIGWPDLDPASDADLKRLVARVRAAGHAGVDGRFIPGLNAVSAPILDWQGEAAAAITLVGGDRRILDPEGPALARLHAVCAEVCPARARS